MEQAPQSQPELERQSERRVFDVGQLTNEQVVRLTILLAAEADERYRANEDGPDDLCNMLEASICQLAAVNPKRGEELLLALKEDVNFYSREMAIYCAGRGPFPYELASGLLLELMRNDDTDETVYSGASLLRERLPPDQVADFEARWDQVEREIY